MRLPIYRATRPIRTRSAISEIDLNSFYAKSRSGARRERNWLSTWSDLSGRKWSAFDGPANPPVTPDDILDTPASKLRLSLQPYLSLLELNFAVDDFLIAVKKRESDVLRGEASNAMDGAPKAVTRRKRVRLPKPEKIYLAVHRHDNMLYYKRLDPEAFAILTSLGRGVTVEDACVEASHGGRKD